MKGQFVTPPYVVDIMVEKLFSKRHPKPEDSILDAGCGDGAFIRGILRWCSHKSIKLPQIVGVESDPELVKHAQEAFKNYENITILNQDFLLEDLGLYNFIIGNPPYVRLEELSKYEKKIYRRNFIAAKNRFDLYILFFEKALRCLAPSGRLVFITPEKYEYTLTSKPLRKLMTNFHVVEIHHLDEDTFEGLITYPAITTIDNDDSGETKIIHRDGSLFNVMLPSDGSPWLLVIRGETGLIKSRLTLKDICRRISCGVATGRDRVFVIPKDKVPESLRPLAHPTVSGKQLTTKDIKVTKKILIPYDRTGKLLPENNLGEFKKWLFDHKETLDSRFCVVKGLRKWYAFHENPPMADILRPKILCKDIAKEPRFWLDKGGSIVPRHSVYYIVPKNPRILSKLLDYLNSEEVSKWLSVNCQRAANGFIRLQSSTIKKLPVPMDIKL